MDIQTLLVTDLATTLGLQDLDDSTRTQFLHNLGDLLIEGAVLRYLEEVDEDEQSVFTSWLQAHGLDKGLLERLLRAHPRFEKFLTEEIMAFKNDAQRISGHHHQQQTVAV